MIRFSAKRLVFGNGGCGIAMRHRVMRRRDTLGRLVSTQSKDHAKLASDSGTFLAGIGGILCAGIALQQYYMAKSQTECTATLELLKVRCQPEIQDGFDKIVAFKKKMHAKAKLKSGDGCNDYADRFAAALWFSQNSSALDEVFDRDGDHCLTREEMAIGLYDCLFFFFCSIFLVPNKHTHTRVHRNAYGCSSHLAELLTVYFFENQGDEVSLVERCLELKPQWDEADRIDKAALCLRGLFHKLRALIDLRMMSREQAAEVPGRRFTRGFIKAVEPLMQAKQIRLYHDTWDRNRDNCLFQFCREMYDIHDIPEPHDRDDLSTLVSTPKQMIVRKR